MVCPSLYFWESVITGAAIAAGLAALVIAPHQVWPFGFLAIGAVAAAVTAFARGAPPFLNGVGAIYIGVPSLSVVACARIRCKARSWSWRCSS